MKKSKASPKTKKEQKPKDAKEIKEAKEAKAKQAKKTKEVEDVSDEEMSSEEPATPSPNQKKRKNEGSSEDKKNTEEWKTDFPKVQDKRSLFVGGLSPQTKEAELKALFSKYGTIAELFYHSVKNLAFISFEQEADAQKALELNGTTFTNSKLYVTQSRPVKVVRTITVVGLYPEVTFDALYKHFSKFGELRSLKLNLKNKERPVASVGFAELETASKAYELDGTAWNGHTLRMSFTPTKKGTPYYKGKESPRASKRPYHKA